MAKEISFIAERRNSEENVIMIYTCEVSSQHEDANSVVNSLKKALTDWAKRTPEGEEAWENSACDFNFADLAIRHISGSLQVFLENAGIFEINIIQIDHLPILDLDTVLMNSDELKE